MSQNAILDFKLTIFALFTKAHDNSNVTWSLQDAIATGFEKFLDKSQAVNHWQCGLDLDLNTGKNQLFSRRQYDKNTEQQQRLKMKQYAINDRAAIADLFFHMCPEKADNHQVLETPTTTSTNIIINFENELSDFSEDELIQILMPKFNKREPILPPPDDDPHALTITTTQEEMNEFNLMEEQQQQQSQIQTTTLTKSEQQRRKNLKLKWKQKNHPDFQPKIKRLIYHRYDY
ncbi:unnamed protein product [Rotaria sp. Silwood1]|nr:unnamed protein product [Rotaria sp. Silwood1]CAF1326090.1 unnamed protein product [Rotaria sp. Silwood1]CAF1327790.1 unnamed protein product [Rotaria sp. Silwood1]